MPITSQSMDMYSNKSFKSPATDLGLNYINSEEDEYLESEFKEDAENFLKDVLQSTRLQAVHIQLFFLMIQLQIEELISDLRKDQQNQQALLIRTLELMRDQPNTQVQ
ncbi:UNKNOWN [Stylonychia lemnae]|uniref:Uncharacterized protein n=1 Tax=Stylonychia lemnae TaxID=5949 RepID=A0A078A9G5_STYLE|nr:UNKNOWN [Stylonychia lemnae]|eukprot:CDW77433.1 UNKNOWN [Stylonychia lemnae]